jgi:hypothetical protein
MTGSPAHMLLGTATGAERARRLLSMPDAVLISGGENLARSCRDDRAAHDFITTRLAALTARRDETGALMPGHSIPLAHARMALRKVAGT